MPAPDCVITAASDPVVPGVPPWERSCPPPAEGRSVEASTSARLTALAMPKSVTMAAPPASMMLSGLMSRCTTPRSCAYASARATSRRMPMHSATGRSCAPCCCPCCCSWRCSCSCSCCRSCRDPSRARRRSRSDGPSSNGITKYNRPSASPESNSGTMFGCRSRDAMAISRRNRARPSAAATSGRITFTATSRSCLLSCATYTRAMPPRPSSRPRRYRPPSVSGSANGCDSPSSPNSAAKPSTAGRLSMGSSRSHSSTSCVRARARSITVAQLRDHDTAMLR